MKDTPPPEAIAAAWGDLPDWRSAGNRLVTACVATTVGDALALAGRITTLAWTASVTSVPAEARVGA